MQFNVKQSSKPKGDLPSVTYIHTYIKIKIATKFSHEFLFCNCCCNIIIFYLYYHFFRVVNWNEKCRLETSREGLSHWGHICFFAAEPLGNFWCRTRSEMFLVCKNYQKLKKNNRFDEGLFLGLFRT